MERIAQIQEVTKSLVNGTGPQPFPCQIKIQAFLKIAQVEWLKME